MKFNRNWPHQRIENWPFKDTISAFGGEFRRPLAALDRCTLNKGAFAFKIVRGALKWPLDRGSRLIQVAATAGLTVVNFPFLDGDVPRSPSYGVYISQLIRFARVCSNVDDFNNRNLFLTAKLLKQGYRYHKIRKAFSNFYYRHSEFSSATRHIKTYILW